MTTLPVISFGKIEAGMPMPNLLDNFLATAAALTAGAVGATHAAGSTADGVVVRVEATGICRSDADHTADNKCHGFI